ncbi:pimeloyl-ACP methyl ester carboxylesterase [Inquilinus ginsengisoli]|uniref:alpha/beta fold hydrolase n=1 Tax=Inquilinus ginsengisoli TaxID=363840 RepID=UPI003D1950C8
MSILRASRAAVLAAALAAGSAEAAPDLIREELRVTTADGIGIRVREVRPRAGAAGEPIILVHGARVPGIASFDLDVPGSSAADPDHPGRLSPKLGGYRLTTAASLFPSWDESIPAEDKASWRDPAVAEAYARAALASDPASETRDPPAFRAPAGAAEDSFYQAAGRRLFDAGSITAPVLLVRSEHDFWSRPEDMAAFAHDTVRSEGVRSMTLPGATHYVHLDRPERGRDALIAEIAAFLGPQTDQAAPNNN